MKDIALVLVVVAGCVMASGVLAAALVALSARRSGRSIQAEALIAIAAPEHRPALTQAWRERR